MKNYFNESLPELVVPTQVIIGRDELTNKKKISEIQPRMSKPNTARRAEEPSSLHLYQYYLRGDENEKSKAEEFLNYFITKIRNDFSPETIGVFKHELPIFINEISKMAMHNNEKYFPFDCANLTNLLFTGHGLRLVDTNGVIPVPTELPEHLKEDEDMEWRKKMFTGSLKILELIESKL